jgi:NAD(P)-dependent dehydrogenase (short-subunit alcohol dehydrogenase family)
VAGLKRTNADVEGVKADVSLKEELQAAAEVALARYGEVHIVHNNAGVGGGGNYAAGWSETGWDWTSQSTCARLSGASRSSGR